MKKEMKELQKTLGLDWVTPTMAKTLMDNFDKLSEEQLVDYVFESLDSKLMIKLVQFHSEVMVDTFTKRKEALLKKETKEVVDTMQSNVSLLKEKPIQQTELWFVSMMLKAEHLTDRGESTISSIAREVRNDTHAFPNAILKIIIELRKDAGVMEKISDISNYVNFDEE